MKKDQNNESNSPVDEENPLLNFFKTSKEKKNSLSRGKFKENGMLDSELDLGCAYSFRTSPKYINGTLREYQIEGVNWLISMHEKNINCILADEMGLGKTLQTIAFLGYLKKFLKNTMPNLLIVPKSLLHNWKAEFAKFLPSFKLFIFHTTQAEIKDMEEKMENTELDVVLTTYEMCISAKKVFKKIQWCYLVIDEAHRIKNEASLLSKIVRIFECEHRLLLTGTPLQNNVHELWALLNFLDSQLFKDPDQFEKWISQMETAEKGGIDQLRKVLQLFFLRREKREVEQTLLPKKVTNLYPRLTNMQRNLYKMLLEKDLTPLLNKRDVKNSLLNVLIQLRKCCNHPYLFDGMEPGPPYTTDMHLVFNSGKMIYLDKLLLEMKKRQSRVLIFSQMTRMLDILEDYCVMKDYEYRRIDGSTSAAERGESIDGFNAANSDIFVFLLSTRAGGLGINLATADVVIMYDSDWNPQIDLQAQDRAHRIGQTKQVLVFKLITENSVEEKIIYRALKKLKLDEILVKNNAKTSSNINEKELIGILAEGVEDIFEKDENPATMNIEEIIKMGEEKTKILNTQLENVTLGETQEHNIELYEWEGEDYKNKAKIEKYLTVDRRMSNSLFHRPKQLILPDYHFYPKELFEIIKKEDELYKEGKQLSEEQAKKKREFIEMGFRSWSKKDFLSFIRVTELYGRNNIEALIKQIDKTEEDIRSYHSTFWERIDELDEKDKILSQIEKNEQRQKKERVISLYLKRIFDDHEPARLKNVVTVRSKNFTEKIDLIILKGYYYRERNRDYLQNILMELKRKHVLNYFIRTLTGQEVQKRLKTLKSNLYKMFSINDEINRNSTTH